MNKLIHSNLPRNPAGLPLFQWADARTARHRMPASYPVRILGRRHHLPPARAALVASLAGFHVGEGI